MFLKQGAATTIYIGPAVDATGGDVEDTPVDSTPNTTTSSSTAGCRIWKGASAGVGKAATINHDGLGTYSLALASGDVDTLGRFKLVVADTAAGIGALEFNAFVLPAWLYDFITSAGPGVGARDISNVADASLNLVDLLLAAAFGGSAGKKTVDANALTLTTKTSGSTNLAVRNISPSVAAPLVTS